MKIFQLLGAAKGEGVGMSVIRKYMPDFALSTDSLEFTACASLELEGKGEQQTDIQ